MKYLNINSLNAEIMYTKKRQGKAREGKTRQRKAPKGFPFISSDQFFSSSVHILHKGKFYVSTLVGRLISQFTIQDYLLTWCIHYVFPIYEKRGSTWVQALLPAIPTDVLRSLPQCR